MPWLWEIWTEEYKPPYLWATITQAQILRIEERKISAETTEYTQSRKRRKVTINFGVKRHLASWTMPEPPLEGTDWGRLYRDIIHKWDEPKGLKNRKRIWESQTKFLKAMDVI
ncbi:hypothetical protein BDW69DRAFT_187212 [Aspergillus filifer]